MNHKAQQLLPMSADISELNLTKGTSINFPEGKDKLMHFQITITPEDGLYRCAMFLRHSPAAARPGASLVWAQCRGLVPLSTSCKYWQDT